MGVVVEGHAKQGKRRLPILLSVFRLSLTHEEDTVDLFPCNAKLSTDPVRLDPPATDPQAHRSVLHVTQDLGGLLHAHG